MITKILEAVRAQTKDETEESEKYLTTKKWEWSFLRKECKNLDLDVFYRTYIHRMQRSYLTLLFSVQTLITLTHILVLLAKISNKAVIPDILIYAFSLPIFVIILLPAFNDDSTNLWRPFLCSFLAIISQVITDLSIPIYHSYISPDTNNLLRPMYGSHNLLTIYIFLPIADNVVVALMGLMTTILYLVTMAFISYATSEEIVIKLVSETLFYLCINFVGLFFRLMTEIDIRKTFIDRRECVQKNLMLKFERNQEQALLLSILPEHIAEKMEKDIKNMVEKVKKKKISYSLMMEPRNLMVQNQAAKRHWSATNKLYAERHSDVSILYADVVNFTQMTTQLPVKLLVETLHELFVKFDEASAEHNVLRIKFLGDCYYCVSGVPIKNKLHAKNCVELGLQMIRDIRELRVERNLSIDMRIGIHSGSIIGGVMGANKWQYDIWSKDVIIANKIESTGVSGKIHITNATLDFLHGEYAVEEGTEAAKNDPILVQNNIKTFLISPRYDSIEANGVLRRQLSLSQNACLELNTIRKNFMHNSMEKFRDIMRQTNIEMERELDRMPIGKFQFIHRLLSRKDTSTQAPVTRYYGSDSFSEEYEDHNDMTTYYAKKMNQLSKVMMKFRGNAAWEWPFLNEADLLLKYSMLMSCVVLMTIFAIQVLNRAVSSGFYWYSSVSSIMMFIISSLIWFKKIWDFFAPVLESDPLHINPPKNLVLRKLYDFSFYIISSAICRTLIYLTVVTILITVSMMHLIEECMEYANLRNPQGRVNTSTNWESINDLAEYEVYMCLNSWSVTQCIVLTICVTFLFQRIHFLLKFMVGLFINLIYSFVIFYRFSFVYESGATVNPHLDPKVAHLLKVIAGTIIFHLIDRQSEYIQRVGFIWKQQLLEKKEIAVLTKETNKILVHNILPMHVADLYLSRQYRNDLYSEEYENVAVMFATIMNFASSTSSLSIDSEHVLLKNLNEIICAFDEALMSFGSYRKVEKIKVAGWSYMAACGLDPGRGDSTSSSKGLQDGRRSLNMCVSQSKTNLRRIFKTNSRQSENAVIILTEFALRLMRVLKRINEENEHFKNRPALQLRIGISHGKVMAGVIGSSKPLYDIWGNSVNMASRMDSCGVAGKIQVTEETADVLEQFGVACTHRGNIFVKGKGMLPTYFVLISDDLEFIKNDCTSTHFPFETKL